MTDNKQITQDIKLVNLIDLAKLKDLVSDYSLATDLTAKLVMKPEKEMFTFFKQPIDDLDLYDNEEFEMNCEEMEKNRIVSFNGSRLCELIQKSPHGKYNCMKSCLSNFENLNTNKKVTCYHCHMGLTELVSPINVGSYHVANIQLGRAGDSQNEDWLHSKFRQLQLDSYGVKFEEFQEEYGEINRKIEDDSENHLANVAEIISDLATSQLTLQVIHDIGREVSAAHTMCDALQIFLNHTKRLIKYDTGCIWLLSLEDSDYLMPASAVFLPSDWESDDNKIDFYKKRLYAGDGLVGKVLKDKREIICNSKEKINEVFSGADKTKKLRNLKSFLGIPMWVDNSLIGVFELGAQFENAFPPNVVLLMRTIVAHASVTAQRARLTEIYTDIIQSTDFKRNAFKILCKIAGLVNSQSCSLFLRKKQGEGPAYLFASKGLQKNLIYEDLFSNLPCTSDKAYYEEGMGLTGWILKTGIPLKLDQHSTAEERIDFINRLNMDYQSDELPLIEWKGIYIENNISDNNASNICDLYAGKSWMGVPIKKGDDKVIGVLRVFDKNEGNFTENEQKLLEACASYIGFTIVKEMAEAKNKTLMIEVMTAFATAIDAKDPYTEGHSQNVKDISLAIGSKLGLSENELMELEMASLLHDIGKIGIPDVILSKPGKLNYAEKMAVQVHSTVGYSILKSIENMNSVKDAILDHHERYDGEGYPNKKSGENISKLARIISVADTYDAITTKRPYKDAVDPSKACQEIVKCAGSQFDPVIVKAFLDQYGSLMHIKTS
jgi:HD-GYP domain-containing protein (c-di-GMP phosphodiesterase class II)/ligand-binding sensor protein